MKKMMIIAVLIGGMLMPAQLFANNDRANAKPRVENNGKRKEIRVGSNRDDRNGKKPGYKPEKPGKNNKPGRGYKPGKPGKPAPVIVVNRPAPRPCPPPPPPAPRRYYYDGAADAVGAFLSIVGLMAIIAD